jgi:methionine salvage enolase-phosphatase E1
MTEQYRLMVYAGIAILHFYRKDVFPHAAGETLGDFARKNDAVLLRVVEETRSTFHYELSHQQIGFIINAYIAESQSIRTSTPFSSPSRPDIACVRPG